MAVSSKLLIEGEREVLTVRTHVKALLVPFVVLILIAGAAGFTSAVTSGTVRLVVIVVAVLILLWWVLLPFLRWLTTTYTITNKRLIEQTGLLTRSGRIIPLSRINDVAYEKHLSDRILGCGTLIVHDASEQEGMKIVDVPQVEDVHRQLTTLVFSAHHPDSESDERI
ncbi:PH (Pleckstrin Homology) domain-containing protein [Mumia flava]|uniref:PH (Pleckstrin Homology) domain-containing protein n=1 Tax=Mumia flava TaxID=1348852 RepID=A0A0B2BMM4_9ACTN|nr:PH domain-containing protein [Mumia flava]PJJ58512.1 PH (Pleckstrin Homology) domain-containing protein [Mumia flava]